MIISGIADEAGADIATQIRAHKELGWDTIELRLVDGRNAAGELPDAEFDNVVRALDEAGLKVTGFASAIGNWSRNIREDFAVDRKELETAAVRMRGLGVKFIRTMSWVGDGVDDDAWRDEALRRYQELAKIAEDNGVILAHENCTGWAGQSADHMLRLLDAVKSDNLTILFDIGNTVGHGEDPWEFYQAVRPHISYVHIKDRYKSAPGEPARYAYPGEGDAQVARIIADLDRTGYQGVASIEPHVASVVHDGGAKTDADTMYQAYLRYGRQARKIVDAGANNEQV